MAYFECEKLYKSYGNSPILKGISFNLDEGDALSIIGRSGCGKTTLLRCLNYLERINGGEVRLNGETLLSLDYPSNEKETIRARSHYGLVFQSFHLFPQYTVYENIALPLRLNEERRKKGKEPPLLNRTIEEEVMELLSKIGLHAKRDFYPGALSGGQSQRVAIARALALKPEILCFDEPTSALDPELTGEVLKVIEEVKKAYKCTMIIVTHEMAFAKRISDKVLFMDDGQIVEFGKVDEVFGSGDPRTKSFLDSYVRLGN